MTGEVCRDSFSISTRELARELNSQETIIKIRDKALPYVVIVLDDVGEMLDAAGKEIATDIMRLIAKGHAVGIHLVASAERMPASGEASVLANFPARIAFRMKTTQDADGFVGDVDAAALPGGGYCLYRDKDNVILRLQAPKMVLMP